MKQNKNIHTTIDESLTPGTAEADIALPFQARPFVIRGVAEAVIEAVQQAAEALPSAEPVNVPLAPQKPNTAHFTDVSRPIYQLPSRRERIATYFADAKLRKFDKLWDTNLYEKKLEQRKKTATFLMASEAGLFDSESVYYRAQLKRMVK